MKKKLWIIISIIVIIGIGLVTMYLIDTNRMENNKPVVFSTWGKSYAPPEHEEVGKDLDMKIVLSLEDNITENSVWCGTFNLIWNDLKNDLAKQDIVFTPQLEVVKNLNKGTFNTSSLSENSYYKVYGRPTLQLKKEIEEQIRKKFNETSDILDDFQWDRTDSNYYFLYAMLKKEFEFPKVFSELPEGEFRDYKNVKYFGINSDTNEEVRNQVQVLYYNSKDDFAIKLLTKNNDEVIIAKGIEKDSFKSTYEEITNKENNYKGSKYLDEQDIVKIPNINFDLKEEIKEVENKIFEFSNGEDYIIQKAMQTIKFELDKKGGKIKSEAGMTVKDAAVLSPTEPRKFEVDDTFTIFLKETEKDLPYFAAKISNISNVQPNTKLQMVENKIQDIDQEKYFYGKIIEKNKNTIIVEPNEGEEIKKSTDKIAIDLDENNDIEYVLETNVKVTYKGYIMETYPAKIDVKNIEVKSVENFEIKFYKKEGKKEDKIIDKEETNKYNYNIYAYDADVNIVINGQEIPLRKALLENKITMEEIIAKANEELRKGKITGDMYKDGGSMIYNYEGYTIIKYHSIDGNRDVYIGENGMEIKCIVN